jgi:hypothetical protein
MEPKLPIGTLTSIVASAKQSLASQGVVLIAGLLIVLRSIDTTRIIAMDPWTRLTTGLEI